MSKPSVLGRRTKMHARFFLGPLVATSALSWGGIRSSFRWGSSSPYKTLRNLLLIFNCFLPGLPFSYQVRRLIIKTEDKNIYVFHIAGSL